MNAPLLPGFDLAPPATPPATLASPAPAAPYGPPPEPPAAAPAPGRLEMSPAWFQAKRFLHTLSRQQRAAIAGRPRFYSMPWLRRADDAALDDCLP